MTSMWLSKPAASWLEQYRKVHFYLMTQKVRNYTFIELVFHWIFLLLFFLHHSNKKTHMSSIYKQLMGSDSCMANIRKHFFTCDACIHRLMCWCNWYWVWWSYKRWWQRFVWFILRAWNIIFIIQNRLDDHRKYGFLSDSLILTLV